MSSALPPGLTEDDLEPGDAMPPGVTEADLVAPPPAPRPPPVLRAVPADADESIERQRDAYVSDLFRVSEGKDADRWAGILALRKKTGASFESLEEGYDDFAKSVEAAGRDPRRWRRDNPEKEAWLTEDPKRAPLLKEEKLYWFQKVLRQHEAYQSFLDVAGDPGHMGMLERVARVAKGESFFESDEELLARQQKHQQAIGAAVEGIDAAGKPKVVYQEANPARGAAIYADVWSRGRKQAELARLGTLQLVLDGKARYAQHGGSRSALEGARRSAYENRKRIELLREEMGGQQDYDQSAVEQLGIDVVEGAASQVESLKATGVGAVAGAAAGAAIGAVAGGVGALPGAAYGAPLGIKLLSFASSFNQETGGTYLDLLDATDENHKPVDPGIAAVASVVYGLGAAGIELATLGPMLKSFGPLGNMIRQGEGRAWMKAALADRRMSGLWHEIAKDWAKEAGGEGGEEMAQTALEFVTKWAGTSISARHAQTFDTDRLKEEALTAGYKGAVAGAAIGAVGSSVSLAQEAIRLERSRDAAAHVAAITGIAKTDVARQVPRHTAALIERETRSTGAVTHMYVDAARLTEHLEKGGSPDQAARDLLGDDGPDRIRRALAERMDQDGHRATLAVPLEEYLEKIGPKPIAEELVEDVTTRPTYLTVREQRSREGNLVAEAEAYAAAIDSVEEPGAASTEAPTDLSATHEERFVKAFRQQLVATKRMQPKEAAYVAKLQAARIRTALQRSPKAADEMFREMTLTVQQAAPELRPAVEDKARAEYEALSPEAQQQALFRDQDTQLLTTEGLEVQPRDPARPLLAQFDLEGGKLLNDELGHETLDGAYRAMAAALRAAGIDDGAKAGGSIVAWVRDEAHAAEMAAAMRQAVDPRLQVTFAARPDSGKVKTTLRRVGMAHKAAKSLAGARGELGHRKGVPSYYTRRRSFLQRLLGAAPPPDFETDAKSPEARALIEGAAADLAPRAAELAALPVPAAGPLAPEHGPAFESTTDRFSRIYKTIGGLLSHAGMRAAQRLNPQPFQTSGDIRASGDMNTAFGHEAVDAIGHWFEEILNLAGGGRFDVARPHGDEFFAHGKTRKELAAFFQAVREITDAAYFFYEREDGSVVVQDGLSFAVGTAETLDVADRTELPAAKRAQDAAAQVSKPRILRTKEELQAEAERRGAAGGRGIDVSVLVGRRNQEARARAAGAVRNQRLRLLSESDRSALAAKLRQRSPEAAAAAADTASKLGLTQAPPFRSVKAAFDEVMSASFPDGADASPTQQADGQWLRARDGKGEMPPPYPDGRQVDAINEYLDLRGDKRVRGVLHGFVELAKSQNGGKGAQRWEDIEQVVMWMQENVPGLDKLRMPDAFIDYAAARDEEAQRADEAAAWYEARSAGDVPEGIDTSFDPDTLTQPGDEDRRGFVEMAKDGIRQAFKIFLTEQSDLSTTLHELGHTYLRMLGTLAEHPDADPRVREDYARALKWLGVSPGVPVDVVADEKWARAFEAYLREGKAPAPALAEAFATFRRWLMAVYETLAGLDVHLDDDIRGIFDRMLATDAEIKRAREAAGVLEPLKDIDPALMPEYLEKWKRGAMALATKTRVKIHEAEVRAAEAFKTAEFARVKAEASDEWDRRPDAAAWLYVRKGAVRLDDGSIVTDRALGKLDRKLLQAYLGKGSPLEEKLKGRLTDDGAHPMQLAQRFGFPDAKTFLDALDAVPDQKAWVQARAEELMRERHPEIDGEIANLNEAILKLLHEEATDDALLLEMRDLDRKAGGRVTSSDVVRRAAELSAAKVTAGRIDTGQALNRESAAADAAIKAAAKGDYSMARVYKRQQVYFRHLWRELQKAGEDRDRFLEAANAAATTRRREVLGRAGRDFLDAADQILEALGIKPPEQGLDRMSVEKALTQIDDDAGAAFSIDDVVRVATRPPDDGWRGLTIREMRVVHRALAQLYTVARDRNAILFEGRRRTISELVGKIAGEASVRVDLGGPDDKPHRWRGFLAGLLEPAEAIRRLGATAYKALWTDGYIAAEQAEDVLLRKVGRFFAEHWEKLPKALQDRRFELLEDLDGVPWPPDVDRQPVTDRQWMWMVALNMGNASNRERLLGGYRWDESHVLAWLDRNMEAEEWAFVQSVWDLLDRELYPEVARTYEEATGLPPEKIEAVPIKTQHGTFAGGYFPAKYDPVLSRVGQKQDRESLEKLYHQKAGAISVGKSFTKPRAGKYEDLVRLDWGVVPGHVMSVVHYAAFDRFVRNARSLLMHPDFAETARHRLGAKDYDQLVDADGGWLAAVASASADAIPQHMSDPYYLLGLGKAAAVTASIGWSIPTAMGDLSNPLVAALSGRVSMRYAMPSMMRFLSGDVRSRALELSPEIRHRRENIRRKVRQQMEEIGPKSRRSTARRLLHKAQDTAWVFMDQSDKFASTVIWDAAFNEATDGGKSEAEAVAHADDVLRSAMPSQDQARKPSLLRDKRGIGQILVFYGYFNKLYNQSATIMDPAVQAWAKADGWGDRAAAGGHVALAAGRVMFMLAAAQLVGELLSGRGPEDDEKPPEWIMRKMLAAPFMLFPWIGGPAEALANRVVSGKATRQFNMRSAPAFAAADRLWKATVDADDDKRLLGLLEAAGVLTLTPLGSSQARRMTGYFFGGGLPADLRRGGVRGALGVVGGAAGYKR